MNLDDHLMPPCRVRRCVLIPTESHRAMFYTFDGLADTLEHFAVEYRGAAKAAVPLVRVHSECVTGDLFSSSRCDCGDQLRESIELLQRDGGVLLYLRQEGRGIGLYSKLDAYVLQDQGYDTYEANLRLGFPQDARRYIVAAQMLQALHCPTVRLISNNPEKRCQLERYGIVVTQMLPTGTFLKAPNRRYLQAKVEKAQHTLRVTEDSHDSSQRADQWRGDIPRAICRHGGV